MREIKFRVWDEQTKRMWFSFDKPLQCNFVFGKYFYLERGNNYTPIKMSKPMQYTGLKDKNGKEIYEGDIVNFAWNNGFGGIFYERGIVQCNPPTFDFLVGKETWRWIESNIEVEVIGNIYENPELVKEEK